MIAQVAILISIQPDSTPQALHGLRRAIELTHLGFSTEVFVVDADTPPGPGERSDALTVLLGLQAAKTCRLRSGYLVDSSTDIALFFGWRATRFASRVDVASKAMVIDDIEAWQHPVGDDHIAAEAAVYCGLPAIALGQWVNRTLATTFGVNAYNCRIGIDPAQIVAGGRLEQRTAVCAIWTPDLPSSCPSLTIEALGIFNHFLPEVELVIMGPPLPKVRAIKHAHINTSRAATRMSAYGSCCAGLAISTVANYRPGLQMMACGLPVINLFRDVNLYDYPADGIYLADQTAESIAYGLASAVQRSTTFDHAGLAATMARWTSHDEAGQFADYVRRLIDHEMPAEQQFDRDPAPKSRPLVAPYFHNPRTAFRMAQIGGRL